MKKMISCWALLFIAPLLLAQENPFYKNYSWEENPDFSVKASDSTSIIGLKDKIISEFIFEGEDFLEYFLEHKAVWLNSDERIEEYNKIYLPYDNNSELLVNKARVIKPNGEILELDDSKILTAENEETQRVYKFFAFEGIEKGSIIEYYYLVKRVPEYSGKRLTFQTSYDKKDVSFDLYSPSNLVFQFKSFNDLPEITRNTLSEKKLHWTMRAAEIPGLEEESQAAYKASSAFVIYKLDQNLSNNTKDITSYSKVSQNLYNFYYGEIDKRAQKKLNKFLDEAGVKPGTDTDEILRTLESYIKTNVYLGKGENVGSDLESVLNQKVASSKGLMKLFISLFNTLDIKHEIILTSDRQDLKFDPEFEANTFLNEYLFYFPKTDKYMAPTEFDSRYGFPPAYLTDTYGLHIKEVALGDFKSATGKIEYINPVPAEETVDKMIIDVNFDPEDLTVTTIKLDRTLSGYYAMYMQPFMNIIPEENKTELLEDFAKRLDESAAIKSKEMNNADPALFGIKPLQFVIDFESEAFVEKAGNRYLFKVGDLIGRQIQMYQENERKLPLEDEFTRTYYRTINVKIPEGYRVANAEDININHSFSKDGKEVLMFKSFYEMDGDTLKITADEFYKINKISKEFFEDYRTVVNSAADFNKVTLVLEPK
ncbi:DUF3857 domain-containing protein [Aequorivita lipolytica]|uniref:DUF3857 domain-containing protein n=1 Tax=Aequorivita lipolytica TaxID=153267 RepID=A0A5C6YQW7_9FLAO|nr:DUF3857 domain-containing protein [Aequorivita lipolytica]TXD69242.1 DUF3857 domain-containing protein [Aequorivita lipolytica]SRX50139.1 hypothetical protein AEQU2_00606 [Aequorivita lipolytica]